MYNKTHAQEDNMQTLLEKQATVVWNHIGFPKEAGVYCLENPESDEPLYAFFDTNFKLWLKAYKSQEIAEEKAVEWMLMSPQNQLKNINKTSSAWQKVVWSQ